MGTVWTATQHQTCWTTASWSMVLTLSDIWVPPSFNYLQYLVRGSILTAVVFSCQPHSLEISLGFYPGPDHQCRLFQTFAKDKFVRSILVHSTRERFLTITALYKSTYLLIICKTSSSWFNAAAAVNKPREYQCSFQLCPISPTTWLLHVTSAADQLNPLLLMHSDSEVNNKKLLINLAGTYQNIPSAITSSSQSWNNTYMIQNSGLWIGRNELPETGVHYLNVASIVALPTLFKRWF